MRAKLGDMRNGREEEAGRGKGMWGEDGDNFPWSCRGSGSGGGGAGVGSGWPQLYVLLLRWRLDDMDFVFSRPPWDVIIFSLVL